MNEDLSEQLKVLEDCVKSNPLSLLFLQDEELIAYCNSFLPYSMGFEIECGSGDNHDFSKFKEIPDIIHADSVKNAHEHRFRIPNGIKGLLCLYNISNQLKLNLLLNPDSGIHYHVDCGEDPERIKKFILGSRSTQENMLSQLDYWGYKGTYNGREVSSSRKWVRLHPFLPTLEFRIGEMTFDYEVLVKRMISACFIVKQVKDSLNVSSPTFDNDYNKLAVLEQVTKTAQEDTATIKLSKINERLRALGVKTSQDIKTNVKTRLKRIII